MRAAALVTGVLGVGTALVFAVAALTATLFPNGTVVNTGWNGGGPWMEKGWGGAVPVPMPAVEWDPPVEDGVAVPDGEFQPLPGDVVVEGPELIDGDPPAR